MPEYEAVIGLEVHVQLSTKSKLFCSCPNTFGQPPNTNTCEVCAGMPGALPRVNAEAVHYAALVGLATNCTINQSSVFARKNYFYPDLPSGYQISQFDLPICEHGWLEIDAGQGPKKIGITRIHMENDAGKNIHSQADNRSYCDLNRAGTPLVEIVSEPDMRSSAEVVAYLNEIISGVVTGVVSRASRDVAGEVNVVKGDYIGFVGDDIYVDEKTPEQAMIGLCDKLNAKSYDVMLILAGAECDAEAAGKMYDTLKNAYRRTEVIMLQGDQPIYDYIMILE